MKTLKLLVLIICSLAMMPISGFGQTKLTISNATSSPSTSCGTSVSFANAAWETISGCPPYWWGNVPMKSTDWLQFDLGQTYSVTQINFTVTISCAPTAIGSCDIQGSNDNINFIFISSQGITDGNSVKVYTINTTNTMYRYIRLANFKYANTPGSCPIEIGSVTIYGSSVTNVGNNAYAPGNLSVNGNLSAQQLLAILLSLVV